jgi:hypothetical protein
MSAQKLEMNKVQSSEAQSERKPRPLLWARLLLIGHEIYAIHATNRMNRTHISLR